MEEEDEDIKAEECGVCRAILKTCKKLGDKTFCKELLEKVKKNEITAEEFSQNLKDRFGEKFNEALEK